LRKPIPSKYDALRQLWQRVGDPSVLISEKDIDEIWCHHPVKGYPIPACDKCEAECCQGGSEGWGIYLNLFDIARLQDNGFESVVTGRFRGIDQFMELSYDSKEEKIELPRLKRVRGRCPFLNPETLRCTSYRTRPGICRRFPLEIVYDEDGSPIVDLIDDVQCVLKWTKEFEGDFHSMLRMTIRDENISTRSDYLLANYPEEVASLGFQGFLPERYCRNKSAILVTK
jgi:Fe-S-cluster containining protein